MSNGGFASSLAAWISGIQEKEHRARKAKILTAPLPKASEPARPVFAPYEGPPPWFLPNVSPVGGVRWQAWQAWRASHPFARPNREDVYRWLAHAFPALAETGWTGDPYAGGSSSDQPAPEPASLWSFLPPSGGFELAPGGGLSSEYTTGTAAEQAYEAAQAAYVAEAAAKDAADAGKTATKAVATAKQKAAKAKAAASFAASLPAPGIAKASAGPEVSPWVVLAILGGAGLIMWGMTKRGSR